MGSPPLLTLLEKLKPRQWFSAHLHVYFKAKWVSVTSTNKRIPSSLQSHPSKRIKVVDSIDTADSTANDTIDVGNPDEITIEDDDRPDDSVAENKDGNPEEIVIEDELDEGDVNVEAQSNDKSDTINDQESTYFTALDKSLPKRKFLEVCCRFREQLRHILTTTSSSKWRQVKSYKVRSRHLHSTLTGWQLHVHFTPS